MHVTSQIFPSCPQHVIDIFNTLPTQKFATHILAHQRLSSLVTAILNTTLTPEAFITCNRHSEHHTDIASFLAALQDHEASQSHAVQVL